MKTETSQIERILEELKAGWSAGSGSQFAAPFAPQARFVAFDGTTLTGPTEIANFHQRVFDNYLQATALDIHIEETRLVAPGVWLVYLCRADEQRRIKFARPIQSLRVSKPVLAKSSLRMPVVAVLWGAIPAWPI